MPTHLFEFSYKFFLLDICQYLNEAIGGGSQFRNLRCLALSAARWNIYTKGLAMTSHRDRCIRFKKTSNPLPEFTNANFERSHRNSSET